MGGSIFAVQQIGPVNIQANHHGSLIAFKQRTGSAAHIKNSLCEFQVLQQNRKKVFYFNFPVHRFNLPKLPDCSSSSH
ncbi:hypothetical protein D3C75_1132080 [compost metagenome]